MGVGTVLVVGWFWSISCEYNSLLGVGTALFLVLTAFLVVGWFWSISCEYNSLVGVGTALFLVLTAFPSGRLGLEHHVSIILWLVLEHPYSCF